MPPSPEPSSGFEPSHWDPLVIALVGIICCVFLLFSYHKILQRHCGDCGGSIAFFSRNPTQSHRRRHLNDENHLDSPSLQFQSRGLDSFLMHSLPITQFKKKKEGEELHLHCHRNGNTNTDDDDCAVCLGEFEDGDWLKHLPNCSHVFHVSCIDTWFQTHSSCPLCRSFVCNNPNMNQNTVSIYALLEALRREENDQERAQQFQVLRTQILQGFETQVAINIDHSTTTSRE